MLPNRAAEAWLFATEPMKSPNALRVRAIVPMTIKGQTATLSKALLPTATTWVVLAQAAGPGAVVGYGVYTQPK
jgi:hypothetical protein